MLSGDLSGKEIQKRGNICICMGFLSGSTGKESACYRGFSGSSDGKESACTSGDPGSIPRSGRFPWRRKWQLTPVFLPGKFHGQRSLEGCSPGGCKSVGNNLATKQQPGRKSLWTRKPKYCVYGFEYVHTSCACMFKHVLYSVKI